MALYEEIATWHIRFDPDGLGPICYRVTPQVAARNAGRDETHPAAACRHAKPPAASPPADPYGTQPMHLDGLEP